MLRKRETRSEALLWNKLKSRHFHGLKFRRQHPVRAFVLDFYCEDLRIGIEIDGSVHDRPPAIAYDQSRQLTIEEMGIRIIRIRSELVETSIQSALIEIERACGFV